MDTDLAEQDVHIKPIEHGNDRRIELMRAGHWTVAFKGEPPDGNLVTAIEKFPDGWANQGRQHPFYPSSFAWGADQNEGTPKYFLKQRSQLTTAWFLRKLGLPLSHGYFSVGLELALADTISEVAETDQVQQFVRQIGFERLHYLKPICAFMPSEKPLVPKKFVVYPYIDGEIQVKAFDNQVKPKGRLKDLYDLCDLLAVRFTDQGIDPHDLGPRQLIKDRYNELWLIDTEGYEPTPQNPSIMQKLARMFQ